MKKRILVIDDEPDFTHILKYGLEANGYYDVQEENEATAARNAAHWFDPDLIILDVMMPGLDGGELAARFKEDSVLRDVPVIFLTALVHTPDAPEGACSSGGHTFLPKNTPLEKLIECMEDKLRTSPLAAEARLAG